jgi:hypothetical protein
MFQVSLPSSIFSILLFSLVPYKMVHCFTLDHCRKPAHVPLHALTEEEGTIKGQSGLMLLKGSVDGLCDVEMCLTAQVFDISGRI